MAGSEFASCELPVMQNFVQKDGVTMLNTAQLIGSVNVVTLKCPCSQIIVGQMGQALVCIGCKRAWFVSANAKIVVNEVVVDLADEVREHKLITQ